MCPWCGSLTTDYSLKCRATSGENFYYYKCSECKSLFIYPLPDSQTIQQAYKNDYYGSDKEKKFILPVEKFRKLISARRAANLAAMLPEQASVLDIGCGNGNFLKQMQMYGNFQLHGTELPGPAAERAKKHRNISVFTGEIDENIRKVGFDLITLFHVFEHLDKPLEILREISIMLKSGGYLVVSMPEPESTQVKLFGRHWFHIDPPRHLCLINRKNFINKAETFGLKKVKTNLFSLEQNPYGFIQSTLNCISTQRDMLYEKLKGNKASDSSKSNSFVIFTHFVLAAFLLPLSLISEVFDLLLMRNATFSLILQKKTDEIVD
jgi:SAM-dependent methyltransferase